MTTKTTNPLSDLIKEVQVIEQEAPASIDKRRHQADAKQIEAIGRLMVTLVNLDKQNSKLEKTNIQLQKAAIFLASVALTFTIYQITSNIVVTLVLTVVITVLAYLWIYKSKL